MGARRRTVADLCDRGSSGVHLQCDYLRRRKERRRRYIVYVLHGFLFHAKAIASHQFFRQRPAHIGRPLVVQPVACPARSHATFALLLTDSDTYTVSMSKVRAASRDRQTVSPWIMPFRLHNLWRGLCKLYCAGVWPAGFRQRRQQAIGRPRRARDAVTLTTQ